MVRQYRTIMATLFGISAAMAFGCGGSSAVVQKKPSATGADAPFGAVGDSSDLKGPEDDSTSDEEETTRASYDPNDLQVPGAQYGLKKKGKQAKKAAKKCKKGKKGRKCRAAAKKGIPFSDAITEQMQGIPWGMHYKAVMAQFEKRIKMAYKEELQNARGAIEEDRVRSKMVRELNKMKRSLIKFDGQHTGMEGVLIGEEFTHNNNEAMFMWDAGKFVEYLFFFEGRFWKRMRSFRKDTLQDNVTFPKYVKTLANRFGEGKEIRNDTNELLEIVWQNDDTYMFARDKSGFYGVYCLVFMARVTQDNLAQLRTSSGLKDGSVTDEISGVVTSVTSGDLSDHNTSVIDGYTGEDSGGSKGSTIDRHHSVMGKKDKKKGKGKGGQGTKDKGDDSGDDIF
ncbi:MAG: hypothetical protein GY847_08445 [Proteobacteria bacterium]|nr:hypothetical protein [Pseudomonadota bacterium]